MEAQRSEAILKIMDSRKYQWRDEDFRKLNSLLIVGAGVDDKKAAPLLERARSKMNELGCKELIEILEMLPNLLMEEPDDINYLKQIINAMCGRGDEPRQDLAIPYSILLDGVLRYVAQRIDGASPAMPPGSDGQIKTPPLNCDSGVSNFQDLRRHSIFTSVNDTWSGQPTSVREEQENAAFDGRFNFNDRFSEKTCNKATEKIADRSFDSIRTFIAENLDIRAGKDRQVEKFKQLFVGPRLLRDSANYFTDAPRAAELIEPFLGELTLALNQYQMPKTEQLKQAARKNIQICLNKIDAAEWQALEKKESEIKWLDADLKRQVKEIIDGQERDKQPAGPRFERLVEFDVKTVVLPTLLVSVESVARVNQFLAKRVACKDPLKRDDITLEIYNCLDNLKNESQKIISEIYNIDDDQSKALKTPTRELNVASNIAEKNISELHQVDRGVLRKSLERAIEESGAEYWFDNFSQEVRPEGLSDQEWATASRGIKLYAFQVVTYLRERQEPLRKIRIEIEMKSAAATERAKAIRAELNERSRIKELVLALQKAAYRETPYEAEAIKRALSEWHGLVEAMATDLEVFLRDKLVQVLPKSED